MAVGETPAVFSTEQFEPKTPVTFAVLKVAPEAKTNLFLVSLSLNEIFAVAPKTIVPLTFTSELFAFFPFKVKVTPVFIVTVLPLIIFTTEPLPLPPLAPSVILEVKVADCPLSVLKI